METEATCMVCRRNKGRAQCVHFCERADIAGITEVIRIDAARKTRTGSGLDGDNTIILFAAEFLSHEGGDESAEV